MAGTRRQTMQQVSWSSLLEALISLDLVIQSSIGLNKPFHCIVFRDSVIVRHSESCVVPPFMGMFWKHGGVPCNTFKVDH